MLTLIRCDGTSNKIILSYSYEITFLPLLHYMKQVKHIQNIPCDFYNIISWRCLWDPYKKQITSPARN